MTHAPRGKTGVAHLVELRAGMFQAQLWSHFTLGISQMRDEPVHNGVFLHPQRTGGKTAGATNLKPKIKVAFASGTDDLNARLIEHMREIFPELPLYVVAEFQPAGADLKWIRYNANRGFENLARCRAAFRGKSIRLAGVMLVPNVPFRAMRLMALLLAPRNFLAFNENLNNFMLRPRCIPAIARHFAWRVRNFVKWHWSDEAARVRRAMPPEIAVAAESVVATYVGRSPSQNPKVLIASPYLPFPLSHGGAVRMYNLMRRTAGSFDQVLVSFTESSDPPPAELLETCVEIVILRRSGTHSLPVSRRPDMVKEFSSADFRAALQSAVHKWKPAVAQLEFTQMAQYAADCAPAPVILVEHDITYDLYSQLLALEEDWDMRRQWKRWRRFETAAWKQMARVVTMSQKDCAAVSGARAVALPNGVDLERFRPSGREPEPRRLLFIGSFAHLPNLLAVEFFLKQVWPLLPNATLHIIAGARHEYYLERYRDRVVLSLDQPGVELEGFVSDVRPAYERAAVVVAPLLASAGTNIKILEAMAMGKAIVSTPAGVNGLDLVAGEDFVLTPNAVEMAQAIEKLLAEPQARERLGAAARSRVEREFGWDDIARRQAELYRELRAWA
jgi:polysaccharide biosynthesis protein PslH